MAASEKLLGQLHDLLAKGMLQELQEQMANGEIKPALLTSIAKFLKDNGMECNPSEDNEVVSALRNEASNVLKLPFSQEA